MPLSDAELARAAEAVRAGGAQYSSRVGDALARGFMALANVDDAAAEAWLEYALPTVEGAQATIAGYAEDYVAIMADGMGLDALPAGSVPLDAVTGDALRQGTTMAEVYRNPIIRARTLLSEGADWLDAMRAGARDTANLARTDVANANRASAQHAMHLTPGIDGYRRVAGGNACAFCTLIATAHYHTDELAPAHPHCTCGVIPEGNGRDPGAILSEAAGARIDEEAVAEAARVTDSSTGPIMSTAPGAEYPAPF